jgi:hypothetical protein
VVEAKAQTTQAKENLAKTLADQSSWEEEVQRRLNSLSSAFGGKSCQSSTYNAFCCTCSSWTY